MDFVQVERDDCLATVTIDRPDRLNALGSDVLDELREAFERLEGEVPVIVLRSTDDRAFVAGADLKEFNGMDGLADFQSFLRMQGDTNDYVEEHPAIVVAEVDALAYGGGFELVLATDMVVASEDAEFAFPEVARGLVPGGGGTQRLARLVGPNKAKELITTGDPIGAAEAERLGVVNRVVPPGELSAATRELADSVTENAPLAVRGAARVIDEGLDASLDTALSYERQLTFTLFRSEDAAEGIRAFVEKRDPEFE